VLEDVGVEAGFDEVRGIAVLNIGTEVSKDGNAVVRFP
jgi:hypothetical protein